MVTYSDFKGYTIDTTIIYHAVVSRKIYFKQIPNLQTPISHVQLVQQCPASHAIVSPLLLEKAFFKALYCSCMRKPKFQTSEASQNFSTSCPNVSLTATQLFRPLQKHCKTEKYISTLLVVQKCQGKTLTTETSI